MINRNTGTAMGSAAVRFDQVAVAAFPFTLGAGEVAVWSVAPDPAAPPPGCLSGPELARARAFQNPAAARDFAAGRQALRALLGRYLGRPPGAVDLVTGPHGKPALAAGSPALSFNLSHAEGVVLVALGRDGELGVDVERSPAPAGFLDVAGSYFSTAEARRLAALPAAAAGAAFLRLWTRKEAVAKACGLGMSLPPDRIRVSMDAGTARVIDLPPDQGPLARWALHDLAPGPDLVAALAVRGASDLRPAGYACSLKDLS
ncbi:MAG: 4'-phosphopantetheinyl transferase superfamily protein [Hyphomicrobiales bacterium]|nr:4'-phosphopantetheinyl transferase superfamily protein [Hyphomicrobiales bacterium]